MPPAGARGQDVSSRIRASPSGTVTDYEPESKRMARSWSSGRLLVGTGSPLGTTFVIAGLNNAHASVRSLVQPGTGQEERSPGRLVGRSNRRTCCRGTLLSPRCAESVQGEGPSFSRRWHLRPPDRLKGQFDPEPFQLFLPIFLVPRRTCGQTRRICRT